MKEFFREQVYKAIAGFEEHFEKPAIDEYIRVCQQQSAVSGAPLSHFLQVSLDEGPELEVGFITSAMIGDVTLSMGKVYSHSMPLETVRKIEVVDTPEKWTLFVYGEKRFDYNVIKSQSPEALFAFHAQLQAILFQQNAEASS